MSPTLDALTSTIEDVSGCSLSGGTCSHNDIEELEDELSLTLPRWYKEFLLECNISELELAFWRFFDIDDAIAEHDDMYPGVDLVPQGYFMFASNDGDGYCCNIFDPKDEAIYYCEHDDLKIAKRFDSLEDMFTSLLAEHQDDRY